MSCQDQLEAPGIDRRSEEPSDDQYRLQIDFRLKFDEIADVEAQILRSTPVEQPTRRDLCRLAGQIYDARRMREKVLGTVLFGEPAWDMLLALYVLPSRGELLRPSHLGLAASVPATTGIRWERILTRHNLIERGPDEITPRRQFVRLTENGRSLMERYLVKLFLAKARVAPYPERAGG